ncbi:MAG: amidase family protein, partial [Burkholderiales bacterium]
MKTLTDLAQELRSGETTSEALVEQCLAAIDDPAGEGGRAFIEVYRDGARRAAIAADKARARGKVPSLIAGIPISIKDLFDVAGEVTRAGSIILA